jgi:glycosyltransferase involved in cell wall biosynthesis
MKIAYITAGAAGMYCGSCMHDNTLAAALIAQGHECLLIPTYTPIRTDERDVSQRRVFFGGISIYLEQRLRLFRHMPGWLDRVLSLPGLLRWVSRFAVKTQPEELGDLTLSMLKGMEGNQRQEVQRLADWLAEDVRPDVVCLTNAILSGIAPELKRRLGVPILCTLQGDDIFLDWLPVAHRENVMALIRANSTAFAGFLTTSRYYADFMAEYLSVPRERTHVVYPGLNLSGFALKNNADEESARPPSIGYLARICPEKGLHQLIDALTLIRDVPWRLRVAGYLGDRDRHYFDDLTRKVEKLGWEDRFEHFGEVDHAGKIAFLQSLAMLSVPTTYREPKGLYILEAWACGVPVVQPRHGSFPELVEATGGGTLVEPGDGVALASELRSLLADKPRRQKLGQAGREAVWQRFTAERMAAETAAIFAEYCRRN